MNGTALRKITPRTKEFLKDAYKVALDGSVPEEASRAVVQAIDRVYNSSAFFFKPRSSEEHEHLMYYVASSQLQ
jgi:hypothetical protein